MVMFWSFGIAEEIAEFIKTHKRNVMKLMSNKSTKYR